MEGGTRTSGVAGREKLCLSSARGRLRWEGILERIGLRRAALQAASFGEETFSKNEEGYRAQQARAAGDF